MTASEYVSAVREQNANVPGHLASEEERRGRTNGWSRTPNRALRIGMNHGWKECPIPVIELKQEIPVILA
jgi:hypothetical protein